MARSIATRKGIQKYIEIKWMISTISCAVIITFYLLKSHLLSVCFNVLKIFLKNFNFFYFKLIFFYILKKIKKKLF